MVKINNNLYKGLKGIIYHNEEIIGVIDNAASFLDMLCQIKNEQCANYKMEVEIEISNNVKRTYVYRFTKDGVMIPSSYPGVSLWTDLINKKLLYLYNFSINHSFSLSNKTENKI